MTASGRIVLPDNDVSPTIEDIALSLAREPRFAGYCRREWSVAEHSLAVAIALDFAGANERIVLLGLVHDMGEAVRGDISRTWKTDNDRRIEWDLLHRMYKELRIEEPSYTEHFTVKHMDTECGNAEGAIVGPMGRVECEGPPPGQFAREAVHSVIDWLPDDRSVQDVRERYLEMYQRVRGIYEDAQTVS